MEPSQGDGDGSETKYGGESLMQNNEVCMYICMCVCVCVCIYIYVCVYIYIYIYIYIYSLKSYFYSDFLNSEVIHEK
jgi:hypothetical protein